VKSERQTELKEGVALLIDADNLSADAVAETIKLLRLRGSPMPIRRAYGGLEALAGMKDVLRQQAVRAMANHGKGTTDVALVVDAMDLLRDSALPDTLAIGSSDADFSPLALRLREAGVRVICFAQAHKAADDLARCYDEVIFVGAAKRVLTKTSRQSSPRSEDADPQSESGSIQPAQKPRGAARTAAKKAATPIAPVKKAPAKKPAAKKSAPTGQILSVASILEVVPLLKSGQAQRLDEVAKPLRDAGLLSKSAATPKLFRKFPQHFELTPATQPNHVRYLVVPA
jgi:NYN domain